MQKFGKSEKHQIGAEQNLVPEIFRWHNGTSKSTQSGAIWHHLETLELEVPQETSRNQGFQILRKNPS